ncbi:hypothetical protein ACFSO7_11655 [Bacillus sp. CGMCC 1.16607]|uniref:hypothetical protein n=1 Tax=Bacillus sp. CGMCC 1.16607 TaxID=3351842 RepID=UPI0036442CE7
MGIGLAISLLTYVFLLVMSYVIIICTKENKERGSKIVNKAYQHAYTIFLFGNLIIIALIQLPHITLDIQTTSYLILINKFISVLTLGGSLYLLNHNYCKR